MAHSKVRNLDSGRAVSPATSLPSKKGEQNPQGNTECVQQGQQASRARGEGKAKTECEMMEGRGQQGVPRPQSPLTTSSHTRNLLSPTEQYCSSAQGFLPRVLEDALPSP